MSRRRIAWLLAVALCSMFALGQGPISAGEKSSDEDFKSGECSEVSHITIPLDTVVKGEPGSIKQLTSKSVPSDLRGKEAEATFSGENNSSVHKDSDLILESGGSKITLEDVEDYEGKVTTTTERLTLGDSITVSVKISETYTFSGGGDLVLEVCTPAPTTTMTTEAPTTTTTQADYKVCEDIAGLKIPVDTVVTGSKGSEHKVVSAELPEAIHGEKAEVAFVGENNGSVHPGSNLILESGSSSITLEDVEGSAGKITESDEMLTLGSSLDVTVVIGKDGVFSGGGAVALKVICEEATTTTTEAPTTTTTEAPTTTTEAPTTTTTAQVEVLPEVVEKPLAKTGADTIQFASLGTLLLLLGTGLASMARRFRSI